MRLFLFIVGLTAACWAKNPSSYQETGGKSDNIRRKLKNPRREGAVRLRGGNSPAEGAVEIYHNGSWGAVCDDEWGADDGHVVCRQLGYKSCQRTTHNSHFPVKTGKFWMDNVFCEGNEKHLSQCRFDGWGIHDCNFDEAAGVICSKKPNQTRNDKVKSNVKKIAHHRTIQEIFGASDIEIRLTGGRHSNEGKIELRSNSYASEKIISLE